jgi:hypothetical protein
LKLTAAQESDIAQAEQVLADHQPAAIIADIGHDSDALVGRIEGRSTMSTPTRAMNIFTISENFNSDLWRFDSISRSELLGHRTPNLRGANREIVAVLGDESGLLRRTRCLISPLVKMRLLTDAC